MELRTDTPELLDTWDLFIDGFTALQSDLGAAPTTPGLDLTVAFAGALVAALSGGTVVEASRGAGVVLPDGTQVLVGIASDVKSPLFGLVVDVHTNRAAQIAFVVFQHHRPVAIHLLDTSMLARLKDTLGVSAPLPSEAPPDALALTTLFHWNLMFEPLAARLCGVRTYLLGEDGCTPLLQEDWPEAAGQEVA